MVLILIDIILAVILLTVIRRIAKGKADKGRMLWSVLLITIIPVIVLTILFAYTVVFISYEQLEAVKIASISILIIELLMFLFYSLFKCNTLPYSKLYEAGNISENNVMLDRSRKLLNLAVYSGILYFLYSLPVIVPAIKALSTVNFSKLFDSNIIGSIGETVIGVFLAVFMVPWVGLFLIIGSYIAIIITIVFTISMGLAYVLAVNSIVHAMKFSKGLRGKAPYLIIMLIPVVNIIGCMRLSLKIKKELKKTAYVTDIVS